MSFLQKMITHFTFLHLVFCLFKDKNNLDIKSC